jgi:hypothetical protein
MADSSVKAIDAFWDWFRLHLPEFDALSDPDAAFWDIAVGQLQQLDERFKFELSHPNGTVREFIITAEGRKEAFPLAEAIVARAPKIPGWSFIALKPPMGFDFQTTYEGICFDPNSMRFRPLVNKSNPQNLGLRVGVPNLNPSIKRQADNAIFVILDTALGERAAALEIDYVEVAPLPESPDSEGYIELHKLPQYIESRERKQRGE